MTDGNISMEEDTELRDLVVQTLENNGVLAKVRAELRASVFLALEEQESVMNPEPLLNKTVKQYLANSEGKLLFSLVREFLEYFGLDCTISVYDPETYFGKEYSYSGRHKLCEELGITSTEPLLGEILKNSMNSALQNGQKKTLNNSEQNNTLDVNIGNRTYELSVPEMAHTYSVGPSINNDISQKLENAPEEQQMNVTDTVSREEPINNVKTDIALLTYSLMDKIGMEKDQSPILEQVSTATPEDDIVKTDRNKLTRNDTAVIFADYKKIEKNGNQDASKQNNVNRLELQMVNNMENKRQTNLGGKTIYFEEIIVDGKKESVNAMHKTGSFLTNTPDNLDNQMNNGIIGDFPPLNGKRTVKESDLKELMHVGLVTEDVDNYEDDFASSASGSTNEQSPSKDGLEKLESSTQGETDLRKRAPNVSDKEVNEEIEETDETVGSSTCQASEAPLRNSAWRQ